MREFGYFCEQEFRVYMEVLQRRRTSARYNDRLPQPVYEVRQFRNAWQQGKSYHSPNPVRPSHHSSVPLHNTTPWLLPLPQPRCRLSHRRLSPTSTTNTSRGVRDSSRQRGYWPHNAACWLYSLIPERWSMVEREGSTQMRICSVHGRCMRAKGGGVRRDGRCTGVELQDGVSSQELHPDNVKYFRCRNKRIDLASRNTLSMRSYPNSKIVFHISSTKYVLVRTRLRVRRHPVGWQFELTLTRIVTVTSRRQQKILLLSSLAWCDLITRNSLNQLDRKDQESGTKCTSEGN